jgi:hypothetical protein
MSEKHRNDDQGKESGSGSRRLFFTGKQVQARLRALDEEWKRTGGFDETYMRRFLKQLDAQDPPHTRP